MNEFLGFQSQLIKEVSDSLNKQMDNVIIEGLRLKGYSFNNDSELHEFIKDFCIIEDRPHLMEKTFFVKSEPFMIHYYALNNDFNFNNEPLKMTASLGKYRYL